MLTILLSGITAMSQTLVTVHGSNNQLSAMDANEIEGIVFEREEEQPVADEEWIDLGLPSGTLWRSTNLGAGSAAASGTFIPLKSWEESNDDYIKLLSNYAMRTPDDEEIKELFDNCTVEKAELDGVKGVKFTGSNGNSIFLPAAGTYYTNDTHLWRNMICTYWSYIPNNSDPYKVLSINVDSTDLWGITEAYYKFNHPLENYYKQTIPGYTTPDYCMTVRPVKDSVACGVIYECETQQYYSLSDYPDNIITFQIVASGEPVLSTDSERVTWEITDEGEVETPETFEDFLKYHYKYTIEPTHFHRWSVKLKVLPNDTNEWLYHHINFIGKALPYGNSNNSITISQVPQY